MRLALGICLAAVGFAARPCDLEPGKSQPWCNTGFDLNTRVADLVSRLTENEKIPLFSNTALSVARLNIPAYQWWSEALHGVGLSPGVRFSGQVTAATSFPQVSHTAMSFNRSLFHAIGSTISTEARAMNNLGQAGLTFWAPNINIFRDPRWGRGQETPGEDPFLTSEYARLFVSGMQQGEDPRYLKVSSCCKHYYDYNLENWGGIDRHHFNAITTAQDLADTYVPAFESCVTKGNASSLMCSYNAVNGVPSCANYQLMTKMARQSWNFQGYITGDCGAVSDVYNTHKYTNTTDATCKVVLESGMDIDCGSFLPHFLQSAIDNKAVSQSTVDDALTHLFLVQFRLGMFDPVTSQPYTRYNASMVNTVGHQELALDASRQGFTLLRNDNRALPLSGKPSVAVIGPNGNASKTMQGNYEGIAPYLITPVAGISKYTSVNYAQGCDVPCGSQSGFAAATALASSHDVTIVIIGLDQSQESEGHDRTSLALPGYQNQLVQAVANAARGKVIVVVMTGGPVDISEIKTNPKVGAILWSGYPGQSGGQALADVLFGTYNPGGRLTYTVYPSSFSQVSMLDVNMRPNTTTGYPGRTYRFYTGQPVYTFGSGLSYTTFDEVISTITPAAPIRAGYFTTETTLRANAPVVATITVTVTNTGALAGSDVVLVYVKPPNPGQGGAPLKQLVGFQRVFLQPGQHETLQFPVSSLDLSVPTVEGNVRQVLAGEWAVEVGTSSATLSISQ
eukprot:TRINITY_DN32374_c0_g1_i1.p1 TRINITY_DN32374_c0_g1~~TRINITY_DN32374_c0_g1_i1.p1  ORF type:complete len:736 (-),score=89.17 TRINITY_DN32374_c0_g1_i1:56-2263(-)